MFRKALLPALAIALLSGCATDYTYRNGSGDYYYGRPQVEYRYIGGYGGYGGYAGYGAYGGFGSGSRFGVGYGYGTGYGGFGYGSRYGYGNPVYYYDRFGRLVYGYPYGAYGAPYSGGYRQPLPRPPYGGGGHDHHDDGGDNVGNDPRPPWRNIGGMRPGSPEDRADAREDGRPRRVPSPFMEPALHPERVSADPTIGGGEGSPRMGTRARRGVLPSDSTPTSDE